MRPEAVMINLSSNARSNAGLSNRKVRAITPFKVIQGHRFGYQSKAYIYDFLLVINTNLLPILHRSK